MLLGRVFITSHLLCYFRDQQPYHYVKHSSATVNCFYLNEKNILVTLPREFILRHEMKCRSSWKRFLKGNSQEEINSKSAKLISAIFEKTHTFIST